MKTAVSIPDELFRHADDLERHRGSGVTEQLDQVYNEQLSALEAGLGTLQHESMLKNDW